MNPEPTPVDYQLAIHADHRYVGGPRYHGCGNRFESKQEALKAAPDFNRERKAHGHKPVKYLLTLTRSSRERSVPTAEDILGIEALPQEAIQPPEDGH